MTRSRLEEILFDNFENEDRDYAIKAMIQAVNEALEEALDLADGRYCYDGGAQCKNYSLQDDIEDLKIKNKEQ